MARSAATSSGRWSIVYRAAFRRAARTTVVTPPMVAVTLGAFDNAAMATFAGLGSFVMLNFADFAGPRRSRLLAYLGLAATGAVLIAAATPLAGDAWPGALAMAVVGFVIPFAGVLGGYVAAGSLAALAAFILAVTIPAEGAVLLDRVAGWSLAGLASALAATFLWPRHESDELLAGADAAAAALGDLLGAAGAPSSARLTAARTAVADVRRTARGLPTRPIGSSARHQARAYLVEQLEVLLRLARAIAEEGAAPRSMPQADRALLTRTAALLREFREPGAALESLGAEHVRHASATAENVTRSVGGGESSDAIARAIQRAYLLRTLSFAGLSAASNAMLARGKRLPRLDPEVSVLVPPLTLGRSLHRRAELVGGQLQLSSVWLRAGLRTGLALGLAVLVAGLVDVSHGFWLVLAALSVLRSNSVGTRHRAGQALIGTGAGFVLAAVLVVAIGDEPVALWALLPVSVFLAAYAPTATQFMVAQAMFTVMVVLLSNLIEYAGWQVAAARVEDILAGTATAVVVGALLWPGGAQTALRASLAALYDAGAGYLRQVARVVTGRADPGVAREAGVVAHAASLRTSDAFGTFLDEHGPKRVPPSVWTPLISAGQALTFAGDSLIARGPIPGSAAERDRLEALFGQLDAAVAGVGRSITEASAPPAGALAGLGADSAALTRRVLAAVGPGSDRGEVEAAIQLVWTVDRIAWLDHLLRRLDEPLAESRRG